MSRPDKVEPSMEEILASIRKIISEEPIGTRPSASDEQRTNDALGRYEPGAEPAFSSQPAPRRPRGSDAVGIDDARDLAQGAMQATGLAGDRSRTLAKPAGAEVRPMPSASHPGAAVDQNPGRPGSGGVEGPSPGPSQARRDLNGHRESELGPSVPRHAADATKAAQSSVDGDAALSAARAKIERHLGTPAKSDGADRPLMLGLKSIRDADFHGAKPHAEPESAGKPGTGGLMARVAAANPDSQSATTNSAAPAQAGPPVGANGAADASTAKAAAQKAADSPAAPNAEAGKQRTPDAAAKSANEEKREAAPMQIDAKPPANASPAAASKAATPLAGERARAFEDAVAEMLRPMLREWLDANLPRLVQQALREEMAKTALPGKDNPTG